jgi:hypothetical protein
MLSSGRWSQAQPTLELMPTEPHPDERRAARFWLFFILGLMGINLAVAGMAIVMAVGDPSFRPMPEYGEHSIDWQVRKQMLADSVALGWKMELQRSRSPDGLSLRLVDAKGMPVTGAKGSVHAYHFTRANEHVKVPLSESDREPGSYFAPLDLARDGRWQVSVDLQRSAAERFVSDQAMDWNAP